MIESEPLPSKQAGPSRLEAKIAALRRRLQDAERALAAIANGHDRPGADAYADSLLSADTTEAGPALERLEHAAVVISPAGNVLQANARFGALLAAPVAEIVGMPMRDLVAEPDRTALASLLDTSSTTWVATLHLCRGAAHVAVRTARIKLGGGGGICLIGTDDEDDVRQTVHAIQRGETNAFGDSAEDPQAPLLGAAGRRYRHLVEQMSDGAVTLSAKGDVLYANPRLASMLGIPVRGLIGHRFLDFFGPEDRALVEALSPRRHGGRAQLEVTVRRTDGASFEARLTAVPADEPGVSLIVTDLTEGNRLAAAEETLRAIASGEIDAFVVAQGDEVRTLSAAHRPYRLMVERMQQGAVTLSPHGDILYTNRPFATMLGRSISTLIGTRLDELVAETDCALFRALLDARHGSATQAEVAMLHQSGARVPVLVSIALLPDEGGVCLIVTDLTTQKAYEAIVAAEALERSILDQAIDAIVVCDSQARVTRASGAAFDLCGRNPLLLPFAEAFPLLADGRHPDLGAVLADAQTLRGKEYALTHAGAAPATVLLSAGPIVDADGRARGCVVTMTDITERRKTEDRLRESDRHKDEFLAILAHELRNPLAPIRTAVEILRSSEALSFPNAAYAVEVIGRQSSNLIRLVDDLLDINRIGQGKIVLQLAAIDMRDVVAQAIETCRPLLSARNHRFTAALPAEPLTVRGDAVRLAQAITNLLSNAANYTPPGGDIDLALEGAPRYAGEARVRVTDNGIGIPADMVTRIFEPYQQANQSRERATGGLGLGLTVCRRLMEMHGGTVEAFSAGVGRGSTFILRLALADAPARSDVESRRDAPAAAGLSVLVVDDNRDAAEALAHLLGAAGYVAHAVTNGAAAVAHATKSLPDVVLLDIGMPGMDGYEVALRLRELPGSDALRVIAMTGFGGPEDRARSHESGIDEHLVKPVDFASLHELLRPRP